MLDIFNLKPVKLLKLLGSPNFVLWCNYDRFIKKLSNVFTIKRGNYVRLRIRSVGTRKTF